LSRSKRAELMFTNQKHCFEKKHEKEYFDHLILSWCLQWYYCV